MSLWSQSGRAPSGKLAQKIDPTPALLLAQDQEIQQLMARFQAAEPKGVAVQELEILLRTALFKPARELVGFLLQEAADRIDDAYQPKPGQHRKGRHSLVVHTLFGTFVLWRHYYRVASAAVRER
jgi:hypothetical protein